MKRKLTILGVCALMALGTFLVFSSKEGSGRTIVTTHSLVVTQDGKLGVQMQPNERAKMTVVVNWSTPDTNASSSATKPGNK